MFVWMGVVRHPVWGNLRLLSSNSKMEFMIDGEVLLFNSNSRNNSSYYYNIFWYYHTASPVCTIVR